MHTQSLDPWRHDHRFGQELVRAGERRTRWVVVLTAVTMAVEVAAGLAFGSMALLADGLHMASHAVALAIAAIAYAFVRRQAGDRRFSFGTGKANALAGFASALLLAGFAVAMGGESLVRCFRPIAIDYDQALLVAGLGLVVNLASLLLLGDGHARAPAAGHSHHDHHHAHSHDHPHDHHHHDHAHGHPSAQGHDHNLRGAYLHVAADALTSVLAILALGAGKLFGWAWLDPAMGILGALLVARWSWGLIADTSGVLLDRQIEGERLERVRSALEVGNDRVADLHLWAIGPEIYAAAITLVADEPQSPAHYRALIPSELGIVHATVEVHRCAG